MSRLPKIYPLAALGSAVAFGWIASERYHSETVELKKKQWNSISAFSTLGTVSAATQEGSVTQISPEPVPETSNAPRISQIMKFGFPSLSNVRSLNDFVLSYDTRNRVPNWVFEHLNAESVVKNSSVTRDKCEFHADTSVHPYFRSHNSDYKGSGFDRGHMAAAGNHKKCQRDCDETFVLSNMAPQVGRGFNRDKWNDLESYCRKLARTNENVYICTGPLYIPRLENDGKLYVKYQVLGQNHVAVPTHFFKVIVCETKSNDLEMEAFLMPNQKINDDTPIETFHVDLEVIERASGLIFFDRISRDQLKKMNRNKLGWF